MWLTEEVNKGKRPENSQVHPQKERLQKWIRSLLVKCSFRAQIETTAPLLKTNFLDSESKDLGLTLLKNLLCNCTTNPVTRLEAGDKNPHLTISNVWGPFLVSKVNLLPYR